LKFTKLDNRAIILIAGDAAEKFLEALITCKVEGMLIGESRFGALLTPQGKIMFDFFVARTKDGFQFDILDSLASDFIKRMMLYKLRAKVEITPIEGLETYAVWDEAPKNGYIDPRMNEMGWRVYSNAPPEAQVANYTEHRIENCVPEGGIDFEYNGAYPHEVLMDQNAGVDFKKGCYVGQEVVSRMQHRGTTKKRVVKISSNQALPDTQTEIRADNKPAGKLGSINGNTGLALVRLDRIFEAQTVVAGETPITVSLADWVNFSWPEHS